MPPRFPPPLSPLTLDCPPLPLQSMHTLKYSLKFQEATPACKPWPKFIYVRPRFPPPLSPLTLGCPPLPLQRIHTLKIQEASPACKPWLKFLYMRPPLLSRPLSLTPDHCCSPWTVIFVSGPCQDDDTPLNGSHQQEFHLSPCQACHMNVPQSDAERGRSEAEGRVQNECERVKSRFAWLVRPPEVFVAVH